MKKDKIIAGYIWLKSKEKPKDFLDIYKDFFETVVEAEKDVESKKRDGYIGNNTKPKFFRIILEEVK